MHVVLGIKLSLIRQKVTFACYLTVTLSHSSGLGEIDEVRLSSKSVRDGVKDTRVWTSTQVKKESEEIQSHSVFCFPF